MNYVCVYRAVNDIQITLAHAETAERVGLHWLGSLRTPNVESMYSPAWIMMVLSMMPKPIMGTALQIKCARKAAASGRSTWERRRYASRGFHESQIIMCRCHPVMYWPRFEKTEISEMDIWYILDLEANAPRAPLLAGSRQPHMSETYPE